MSSLPQEQPTPSHIIPESDVSELAHDLLPSELRGQVIEQSSDCIKILDLDGRLLYMNRGGQRVMEIDDFSTCQSAVWLSFWSGEGLQKAREALTVALQGGVGIFEGEALTAKGTPKWWEVTVSPIFDAQGQISQLLSISRDVTERQQGQLALAEQAHLGRLSLAVSYALTQNETMQKMLTACTQALVEHLDAAFARIWILNEENKTLELQASSGLYTHLDGAHGSIPLGAFKIGRIAQSREPHLTNNVLADENIPEKEWARREGMVAFAGYPLLLAERVVGVMALFATHPLSSSILDAMATIANNVAIGIARQQGEQERLHLLRAEQRAHREAEDALAIRNIFLSNVSHDLKTPLAVIKANLQLIQRRLRKKPLDEGVWITDRLGTMDRSITKMTGMIEDLLDLSRLRASQQAAEGFSSLDLMPLLRSVVTEQQSTTRRHRLALTTDSQFLPMHGNAARLDRVMTNLLNNAIKYSPEGGEIRLHVTTEQYDGRIWARLTLSDHGIGIPASDLAHIFTPFRRASNVTTRIQGTGIGLASVSQVISQHHGTISVISQEGQGSEFTIRVPLAIENLQEEIG